MQAKHQPNEAFVTQLESRLVDEVRRRNLRSAGPSWLPSTPARLAFAVLAIVVVSMAAGGVAVDAAYRAQNNERRDLLVPVYEQRLDIARQGLSLKQAELDAARRRVSIGVAKQSEMLDAQLAAALAATGLRIAELQLEEVRLSGQEPVSALSAPLVRGRDFVGPRLVAELEASRETLRVAAVVMQDTSRRVEIGVAAPGDLELARATVAEAQGAARILERKLDIRRLFLGGAYDAVKADLHTLEAEATAQLEMLRPRIDLARREVALIEARINKGLADALDLAQGKFKLMTLESDLAKAELDLALIRKKLSGKTP